MHSLNNFKFFHLFTFSLALLALQGCDYVIKKIGGNFQGSPQELNSKVSAKTLKTMQQVTSGIRPECYHDFHIHLAGVGHNQSGIYVNPKGLQKKNISDYLKFKIYLSAAGVTDIENADKEYFERLKSIWLNSGLVGKMHLLAFDYNYDESGKPDLERTTLYVPNDYVFKLADENPNIVIPVISIHPDRPDALIELEKYAKRGAKFLKWLPNAMRINPSLEKNRPFYEMMKKYDITLLTHVGEERAVKGDEFQELGNPQLLKLPLDMGVKVIMAHMASLGNCKDLENNNQEQTCFELFWRLFNNKKYEKNLFADISGITIHTRVGDPIEKLIEHPELQDRIVNGSDYPLPAINWIYRTSQLQDLGFITEEEKTALDEIYGYNPLLFDFALKRLLKHPKTGKTLTIKAFETPVALGGCAPIK